MRAVLLVLEFLRDDIVNGHLVFGRLVCPRRTRIGFSGVRGDMRSRYGDTLRDLDQLVGAPSCHVKPVSYEDQSAVFG